MDNSSANIDLIRSHVDIIILKPLESQDRYGLEILKEIETNSNGLFKLKQPTMYSCLKRLEKQGYINSYLGDESNGAQRRYYSLTQQGRDYLESMQSQWEFVRTILSGLVSDVEFDKDKDIQPFDPSKYRPLTKRSRNDDDSEENVKVVEKVVYVPQESEPKELTKEEIKEKLTEEDIKDIAENYLKNHPSELNSTTAEPSTEEIDDSYVDAYIDNMDDNVTSKDVANYFTNYNKLAEDEEAIEEDVAITEETDDEPYQMTFDDLNSDILIENTAKTANNNMDNDIIGELVAPQTNNIVDGNELNEDRTIYTKHVVTPDDLIEHKPTFASYDADKSDTFEEKTNEPLPYQKTVFDEVKSEPIAPPIKEKVDDTSLFDYSRRINEPKREESEKEDPINIFKALDRIYAVNDTPVDAQPDTVIEDEDALDDYSKVYYTPAHYNTTTPENNRIETMSELKAKLQNEGFRVKPYTKINSSEFYINNYYYANRTARDTSLIMFAIFFIESMLAHFIMAPMYNLNFGYLALTWAVAAIIPIGFTIKWAIAPYYKKHTRVSLRLSLMLGLIAALNIALIIFLVGFFGFGADYNDINTLVLPIITPLVFLINIPLYSIVYYLLYRTKRYNLR